MLGEILHLLARGTPSVFAPSYLGFCRAVGDLERVWRPGACRRCRMRCFAPCRCERTIRAAMSALTGSVGASTISRSRMVSPAAMVACRPRLAPCVARPRTAGTSGAPGSSFMSSQTDALPSRAVPAASTLPRREAGVRPCPGNRSAPVSIHGPSLPAGHFRARRSPLPKRSPPAAATWRSRSCSAGSPHRNASCNASARW